MFSLIYGKIKTMAKPITKKITVPLSTILTVGKLYIEAAFEVEGGTTKLMEQADGYDPEESDIDEDEIYLEYTVPVKMELDKKVLSVVKDRMLTTEL